MFSFDFFDKKNSLSFGNTLDRSSKCSYSLQSRFAYCQTSQFSGLLIQPLSTIACGLNPKPVSFPPFDLQPVHIPTTHLPTVKCPLCACAGFRVATTHGKLLAFPPPKKILVHDATPKVLPRIHNIWQWERCAHVAFEYLNLSVSTREYLYLSVCFSGCLKGVECNAVATSHHGDPVIDFIIFGVMARKLLSVVGVLGRAKCSSWISQLLDHLLLYSR